MLIYLIRSESIKATSLPVLVQGNYWISYENANGETNNVLNITAMDGRWVAKSNDEAEIYDDFKYMPTVVIEIYKLYEIRIKDEKMYIMAFPSYDKSFGRYEIVNTNEITIGKKNCAITYQNDLINDVHASISKVDDCFILYSLDNKFGTYVNNKKISNVRLNCGDIIFILGLKIIFMNSFVLINNPNNLISLNGNFFMYDNVAPETPVTDLNEDVYAVAYGDDDYFEKSPRFIATFKKAKVVIDAPPEPKEKDDMPILYTVGPMLTMGMASMVMLISAINSIVTEGRTIMQTLPTLAMSLAMVLTMVFWPVLSNRYKRKIDKQKEDERQRKYRNYLIQKNSEIHELMNKEKQTLLDNNLSLEQCQSIILNKERNLWEREIYQEDFLKIRLGMGNIKPDIDIKYPEEHFTLSEDNLKDLLNTIVKQNQFINNVPIKLSLVEKNITAVIGNKEQCYQFLESLILQAITFQSYRDLKIVFITKKDNSYFDYLKTLPHMFSDDLTMRFYGDNNDDVKQISNYLLQIFNGRKFVEDGKISIADYRSYSNYYLIIADDLETTKTMSIVKEILASDVNYGFSIIFRSKSISGLPKECSTFINISGQDGKKSAVFENELVADKQQLFEADLNIKNRANLPFCVSTIAKIPLRNNLSSNKLPKVLSFLEMYNVGNVEQLNAPYRWEINNPTISLTVPVGVDENGELFKLNLHEKVHGPHGLIAGMTGSGKSEFIITYILSMAINYHPYEVSFVLIDYKGGGLAGAFENREKGIRLPHLAGTITNLDTIEMHRALASIQSELRRRQRLFNIARDKLGESTIDIYKYQKFYREGKVDKPVSHLFIISDEFAELKTQQPEFMKELISIARIGRSLGVHLILATQKPSGVVDDQIWSNSKFRICLKVQDKADSKDMIGNPDAAALVDVGRFYLQVGYNEYFALGQSAWSGAPYYPAEKRKKKVDTSLNFINNIGEIIKSVNNETTIVKPSGEEVNNVINYLINVAKSKSINIDRLWLNQIPEFIYIDNLKEKYQYKTVKNIINPIIGEFDDPNNQRQELLTLNLSKDGNTIIYGVAGSGVDEFLTTLIYSIIENHSSSEVNLYILDFGSEILHNFEQAPQVGDVVSPSEDEKVHNLFKLLQSIISSRKGLLAKFNGDFSLYNQSSNNPLPTIVVVINNYEAFLESYEDCNDLLTSISRECFKYGIVIVMSASNTNAVRYRLSQNFKRLIPLQLNDEYDYTVILGKTNGIVPSNYVGRGLIKLDNIYEFQTAYVRPKDKQSDYIKQFCAELRTNSQYLAIKIPTLPVRVTLDMVSSRINKNGLLPIGIYKDDLSIATYNFKKNYASIISGMDADIFDNFINTLLKEMVKIAKVLVIDTKMTIKYDENIEYFSNNYNKVVDKLSQIVDNEIKMYQDSNYDLKSLDSKDNMICVINGFSNLYDRLDIHSKSVLESMLIKGYETKKVCFVLVDTADQLKSYEYNDWYKKSITKNSGIWLGGGINEQSTIKVSRMPSVAKREIPNNFGFVIKQGTARYVKLVEGEKDGE